MRGDFDMTTPKNDEFKGYDTIVQCKKCGRKQYLDFKYGLLNGWSECCDGLTMPILKTKANIDGAVKFAINRQRDSR